MTTPRTKRRVVGALGAITILGLAAALLLPLLARSSNCGGNSAALNVCKNVALELQIWNSEKDGAPFSYSKMDPESQVRLQRLANNPWLGSARMFVRLEGVRVDPVGARSVIVACETPFNNVPRRRLGKAPLAHAVAYSTGEVGLISTDEFQRLNLGDFTDLGNIEANSVEQSGQARQPIRSETNRTSSAD